MIKFSSYREKNSIGWRYLEEDEIRKLINGSRPWGFTVFGGLREVINLQGKEIKIIETKDPKGHVISDFLRADSNSYGKILWFLSISDYLSYFNTNRDIIEIRDISRYDMIKFCNIFPLILVRDND